MYIYIYNQYVPNHVLAAALELNFEWCRYTSRTKQHPATSATSKPKSARVNPAANENCLKSHAPTLIMESKRSQHLSELHLPGAQCLSSRLLQSKSLDALVNLSTVLVTVV